LGFLFEGKAMPELPEVETIVSDLKKEVLGRTFVGVWTDFIKIIKKPKDFQFFKNEIKGKKIINIRRRGKKYSC
jgi:formamidopyrimidine-DNA glycosylase